MPNEEHVNLDDLHNQDDDVIQNELGEDGVDNDIDKPDLSNFDNDSNENNNFDNDDNESEVELSGTEKFLAQYGIMGGMIDFEDGTKKHYDDLNQDEQFNVLKSIAENAKSPVEQEYDLVDDEIQLLNYIRQQNKPVSEVLQELVAEQLDRVDAVRSIYNEDFNAMSDDAVYLRWLKEADPEASMEDLEESLEAAKKLRTFEKTTENIRRGFVQDQERMIQVEEQRLQQEQFRELEADRETIVNQVSEIKHVAGWDISDEQKNEVLGSLLEVNDNGDSLFMEEVFSDPKTLFEVAWLKKYGANYFDEMANYYKNQISEAYKRGRSEGMNGLPSKPITFSNTSGQKNNSTPAKRDNNNAIDLDSLHADD